MAQHRYHGLLIFWLLFFSGCDNSSIESTEIVMLPIDALAGSAQPHLAPTADGLALLSWLEPLDDGVALRFSTLDEQGWNTPRTVAAGNDWFVNWADFPSVVPMSERVWAAHWLVKKPGGIYSYDVAIAVSNDAGNSWSPAITPHLDDTRTEHGFASLFPWQGQIGAVWLDGRNTAEEDSKSDASGHDSHAGHMTLRSALISTQGRITDSKLIDEKVCDCCQTDVVNNGSGPILVYRNKTQNEIRDIYLSRAGNDGWQPGTPVAVDGWEITGCPVNGPAVANKDDTTVAAWFTAAQDSPRVRFARSADGGANFSDPIDIDGAGSIGRVDVELLDDGEAVVSWLRKSKDSADGEICIRFVSKTGQLSKTFVVSGSGINRSSGFPQMLRRDGSLLFAWTDTEADQKQVVTGQVQLSSLRR